MTSNEGGPAHTSVARVVGVKLDTRRPARAHDGHRHGHVPARRHPRRQSASGARRTRAHRADGEARRRGSERRARAPRASVRRGLRDGAHGRARPPAGQILHRLVGRTAHAATRRRGAVAVFLRKRIGAGSPGNPRRIKPPKRQVLCHATRTSFETERIVAAAPRSPHEIAAVEFHEHESNASLGAFVGGTLSSREGREVPAPRYCPSLESKIRRFPGRTHLVWLEPEGLDTDVVYPNGLSCSLEPETQTRAVRSIPGLENARVLKPGYGVEYDHVDPREPARRWRRSALPGCSAGQINGTTGYEEAAAQGLVVAWRPAFKGDAGRRSTESPDGGARDPTDPTGTTRLPRRARVVARDASYLGVLPDDLTRRGASEPYRMFSSRVENRLSVRPENADARLSAAGAAPRPCRRGAPPPPRRDGRWRSGRRRWRRCECHRASGAMWARCRRRQTRATASALRRGDARRLRRGRARGGGGGGARGGGKRRIVDGDSARPRGGVARAAGCASRGRLRARVRGDGCFTRRTSRGSGATSRRSPRRSRRASRVARFEDGAACVWRTSRRSTGTGRRRWARRAGSRGSRPRRGSRCCATRRKEEALERRRVRGDA